MALARQVVVGIVAGLGLWTVTEYGVHRWIMHGPNRTNPFAEEHLDHHSRPRRTVALDVSPDNVRWKSAGFVVATALATPLVGPATGAGVGIGFTAGYAGYTDLHHRMHHQAPRSRLARRLWQNHFRHHFQNAQRNFGVTTPVWDRPNGTIGRPGPVKVPRRLAMDWLLDAEGQVRPEHAGEYEVAGDSS